MCSQGLSSIHKTATKSPQTANLYVCVYKYFVLHHIPWNSIIYPGTIIVVRIEIIFYGKPTKTLFLRSTKFDCTMHSKFFTELYILLPVYISYFVDGVIIFLTIDIVLARVKFVAKLTHQALSLSHFSSIVR